MTKWMRKVIEDGALGHTTFYDANGESYQGQKRSYQGVEGRLGKTNVMK